MSQRLKKPAKRGQLPFETGQISGRMAALYGCLVAFAATALGRIFLEITSSTLLGWTSLFFLAVFLGLFTSYFLNPHPVSLRFYKLTLLSGAISSAVALALLEEAVTGYGEVTLTITAVLLIPSILGLPSHKEVSLNVLTDRDAADWALRIDALLKYDMPHEIKLLIVRLGDQLWLSPEQPSVFIPVQHEEFCKLFETVELLIKQREFNDLVPKLMTLFQYLNERNSLLEKHIVIPYRDLTKDRQRLINQE